MTTYLVDNSHSRIGFTARHMVFAKVHGEFAKWSASVSYDDADISKGSVAVEIETASIDTREPKRDEHLRSADFFDSEASPTMSFKSKQIRPAGSGRYDLVGDLTIRGTTKEVVLQVEQTGTGKDPWGNTRVGYAAKGALLRSQWGLTWNQALEAGGVLVSDKIELDIEVQLVAQAAEKVA